MAEKIELIDILQKIDRKLGFLIGEKIKEKETTIRGQICELKPLTSDYKEMAMILGISPSHASKELSGLKKGKKK